MDPELVVCCAWILIVDESGSKVTSLSPKWNRSWRCLCEVPELIQKIMFHLLFRVQAGLVFVSLHAVLLPHQFLLRPRCFFDDTLTVSLPFTEQNYHRRDGKIALRSFSSNLLRF